MPFQHVGASLTSGRLNGLGLLVGTAAGWREGGMICAEAVSTELQE